MRVLIVRMRTLEEFPVTTYLQLKALPARSTAVLTVNNRLARRVIQVLAAQISAPTIATSGKAAPVRTSEIPMVAPWSGWLSHLLAQLSFHEDIPAPAHVLDAFAAQTLWARVIEQAEQARPLLDINQAASAAMQADALIDEWNIAVEESAYTQEYLSFERWRDAYRTRLHALDALDPNLLIERVILHLSIIAKQTDPADFSLPAQLVIAGFSEVSPRMSRLLDVLMQLGVEISTLQDEEEAAVQISRVMSANAQSEWLAAAHWARQQLDTFPEGKFAIVAIGLDAEVPYARRVLDQVLSDSAQTPHAFNVAVARPLAQWRAGRAMLAWLRTFVLMKEQSGAEPIDFGAALLSGHCAGHAVEMGQRARIDARWRDYQTTRINLAAWTRAIEGLPMLAPAWQRAWQDWQSYPRQCEANQWAQYFRTTLSTLGFPGQARQSSVAYQVTEALDALLDRFAMLTPVLGRVTASEAWSTLSRLARSAPFQPQRDPGARLDVLGLLEAEGGRWDAVWMLGLTDDVLPASARPNPFIPLSALRVARAPRATPEREHEWAGQIYLQLCRTAPRIIVSAARQEGERGLRASPLIAGAPEIADCWTPDIALNPVVLLDELIDDRGPPVLLSDITPGGVNVLETQSCNPLWGFVRHRLRVRGLEPYATLPSKTLRGIFLHAVMQRIWEHLGDQDRLLAMQESGALIPLIQEIVRTEALRTLHDYPEMWQRLEAERADTLVQAWLMQESKRTPFVVSQIEQKRLLEIGTQSRKLRLELRLDRLDTLGDNRQLVIDYKSGAKLPDVLKDWRQDRPVHLQLPSYAALMGADGATEGLAGFILVQLHSKGVTTMGLVDKDADLNLKGPKNIEEAKFVDATWTQVMHRMNHSITGLADEFLLGVAVNQSWRKNDLQYCDVLPILRVYDERDDE